MKSLEEMTRKELTKHYDKLTRSRVMTAGISLFCTINTITLAVNDAGNTGTYWDYLIGPLKFFYPTVAAASLCFYTFLTAQQKKILVEMQKK